MTKAKWLRAPSGNTHAEWASQVTQHPIINVVRAAATTTAAAAIAATTITTFDTNTTAATTNTNTTCRTSYRAFPTSSRSRRSSFGKRRERVSADACVAANPTIAWNTSTRRIQRDLLESDQVLL